MTDATNTADLYSARWVSKAARIVKTEKSGWCAYLDIVDEDGQYIEAVNICRGISSREVAEALVRNWVRDFAAPAQAEAPAGVEAVGEMRASDSLGVAPYADIWSWLQPGTKLYSATQVQAMLSHRIAPGCQAVRVEPTKEVVIEAYKAQGEATSSACEEIYRAMLAAAPSGPARKPLTDDQILSALDADIAEMQNAKQDAESWAVIVKMTRAIEAAHGIK